MSVAHKCHFHPANLIAKFCSSKQCTLPLCYQCEPIHFQQHAHRQSQPKLLRFNQAYFHAMNQIEQFLEQQRQYFKEVQKNIKDDRQTVLQWIDQYYKQISNILQTTKAKQKQVEEKLAKLKKGSIKTLIFFYSGDIEFPNYQVQFELLNNKIQTIINPNTKIIKQQANITQKIPTVEYKSHSFKNRQYTDNYLQQTTEQQPQQNKTIRETTKLPIQTENIFNNIEDIKKDKYRQKNVRKSIFDQHDKNSKQSNTTHTINSSTNHPSQINLDIKYSYTRQTDIGNHKQPHNYRDPSPKFSHQKNNKTVITRDKPLFLEEDQPISFQQRYSNKPEYPPRPYQQFKRQKNQQRTPQLTENNAHQQIHKQIQKENNLKIMKPSDLQTEGQIIRQNTYNNINSSPNNLINQRNRASSQVNLTDRQFKKSGYQYDLKKQVLPPEQIRKMLQKRIQQRHRILSIKKSDNYQPNQYDQKLPSHKMWETKDSIINQIYAQTKHS